MFTLGCFPRGTKSLWFSNNISLNKIETHFGWNKSIVFISTVGRKQLATLNWSLVTETHEPNNSIQIASSYTFAEQWELYRIKNIFDDAQWMLLLQTEYHSQKSRYQKYASILFADVGSFHSTHKTETNIGRSTWNPMFNATKWKRNSERKERRKTKPKIIWCKIEMENSFKGCVLNIHQLLQWETKDIDQWILACHSNSLRSKVT